MKTSELRQGNLLQDLNGKVLCVDVITTFNQVRTTDSYTHYRVDGINKQIEPIPLTEEWLLKFNEVRKFGGTIYIPLMNLKAEIHFEIYGNHIVSTVKSDFAELILDPIKHVHQLQNLYFVLTNEELTYEQQK